MNALQPLVKQLTKMVKEGYDLGKKELPEVGKQILRYYFWVNLLQSLFGLFGAFLMSTWTFALIQTITSARYQDMDGRWLGVFILGAVALGFLAVVWDAVTDLLRVVIAPRLFLLDTLASYL